MAKAEDASAANTWRVNRAMKIAKANSSKNGNTQTASYEMTDARKYRSDSAQSLGPTGRSDMLFDFKASGSRSTQDYAPQPRRPVRERSPDMTRRRDPISRHEPQSYRGSYHERDRYVSRTRNHAEFDRREEPRDNRRSDYREESSRRKR